MIAEINLIAVLVAAASNMVLGALWYSPMLFGTTWMKLVGVTHHKEKQEESNVWKYYVMGFVNSILMAFALAYVIALAIPTLSYVLFVAFVLWLGFVGTISMNVVMWGGRPHKLWFLDNGYYLLSFILMATIIFYL